MSQITGIIPTNIGFRAYQLAKLQAARQLICSKSPEQIDAEKVQQARELADLQRRIDLVCKAQEKRAAA